MSINVKNVGMFRAFWKKQTRINKSVYVRNAGRMNWKRPFRHLAHNRVIRPRLTARSVGAVRVVVVPICNLREVYRTDVTVHRFLNRAGRAVPAIYSKWHSSPVGTIENSPAIYRWEPCSPVYFSPEGTTENS